MSKPSNGVMVVVLAAGSSKRLGTPKQLLEIQGEPMLRRIAKVALNSTAEFVRVTVPKDVDEYLAALNELTVQTLTVEQPELGQSESIRAALSTAEKLGCKAILFTPCDLPLLTAAHLDELIRTYVEGEFQIVASRYDGVLGAPALIAQSLWGELRLLKGDTGARKVIAQYDGPIAHLDWEGGKFDIDTPQDRERFLKSGE